MDTGVSCADVVSGTPGAEDPATSSAAGRIESAITSGAAGRRMVGEASGVAHRG